MSVLNIGIIGCGPWGLAILERIITNYSLHNHLKAKVHVIDPERLGAGIYSNNQPDYLLLNTECGQIDLFGHKFLNSNVRVPYSALSFFEWLSVNNYRLDDYGEPSKVKPNSYVPRKWLGDYLCWVFNTLISYLPNNLEIQIYRQKAIDVNKRDGKEHINLDNCHIVEVDFAFLTVGHYGSVIFEDLQVKTEKREHLLPYPPAQVNAIVKPKEKVILVGMGLTAVDVISYLTIGRGGTYKRDSYGELHYYASGNEPDIYQCSRSGLPYLSRPIDITDSTGVYEPKYLTKQKIEYLKRNKRKINFREEILPLLFQEMQAVYNQTISVGSRNLDVKNDFNSELLFWGPRKEFEDSLDYQKTTIEWIKYDIYESFHKTGSPTKKGIEVIRVLRDLLRFVVDNEGLTLNSFLDFRNNILPLLYRAVVGPPVQKNEEMLALIRSGILKQPFGPAPKIEFLRKRNKWLVKSTCLKTPILLEVDHLITGFVDSKSWVYTKSGLLSQLVRKGRINQYRPNNNAAYGIDIDKHFHPINRQDGSEETLFVLGVLTEGKKNFNFYIPSPRSRQRAFVDANQCVMEIINKSEK